ncbi:IS3 family transposase [Erwinia typographi]
MEHWKKKKLGYIHDYYHERLSLRLNGLSPIEFRLLQQVAT